MDVYNKLVRDNIPRIIRRQGDIPKTSILDEAAYLSALNQKLAEEVAEYGEAHSVEELVDIAEVVLALAACMGVSAQQFEALRMDKQRERGAFCNRVFLVHVERR